MASSPLNYSFFCLLLLLLFTLTTSFEVLQKGKMRTSNLNFYFHEIHTGPNATIYNLINPTDTPNGFGQTFGLDCILRLGPEPTSLEIGRAHGVISKVDLKANKSLTVFNLIFTAGQYKGSSLAILGMFLPAGISERTVIGGTGCFRMATGFSQAEVIRDRDNLLVAEFYIYVEHYDFNLAEI